MPSSILTTKPEDNIPASKADLRAIFATIKTEIEHGGFFKYAVSGFTERQVKEKLSDLFDARDFGEAITLVDSLRARAGVKTNQIAITLGNTAILDVAPQIWY